ncbi:MAG TPA: aldehyde dehydrogenase family protein [Ktedonobacteraceae bacterium]|nr:aldehyde dehydrogenase family protein [Ktedonobacteraceae bacterium]
MAIEQQPSNTSHIASSIQEGKQQNQENTSNNVLAAYNATTGKVIAELPVADETAVKEAVANARAAQAAWSGLTFKERGEYLIRFRDAMLKRTDEIANMISQEVGKPRIEALLNEIMAAADFINYYVKHAEKMLADEPVPLHLLKHRKSYIHYAPLGVIGIISPWNFPFVLGLSEVVTALIAGNAVILKPSELTPQCGQVIADLFAAVDLPQYVFQVIHGDGKTGAALVKSGVDKICFTGGGVTARHIMRAAADNLTPVIFELGGKDPMIVCADADIERAAQAAVWGAFANCGQICASVERVYVHKSIADAFIGRTIELTRKLRVGNAAAGEDVDIGSMVHERQVQVVERQVQDAVSKGASILFGGHRPENLTGPFYEPTILTDVNADMEVMRNETFGPLLPITVVEDDEEAIRLANDSNYGLDAYVFSKDSKHADSIARRLEAGTVMINDVIAAYSAPEAPWGGVKQSGIGRVHGGATGLKEFCQVRHIMGERIQLPLKRELWWFPYHQWQLPLYKQVIKLLFGFSGRKRKK